MLSTLLLAGEGDRQGGSWCIEEAGHILNFHLVVFGKESAQQYLAVGNEVNCASPMKMLNFEHMPSIIVLFDVALC